MFHQQEAFSLDDFISLCQDDPAEAVDVLEAHPEFQGVYDMLVATEELEAAA